MEKNECIIFATMAFLNAWLFLFLFVPIETFLQLLFLLHKIGSTPVFVYSSLHFFFSVWDNREYSIVPFFGDFFYNKNSIIVCRILFGFNETNWWYYSNAELHILCKTIAFFILQMQVPLKGFYLWTIKKILFEILAVFLYFLSTYFFMVFLPF